MELFGKLEASHDAELLFGAAVGTGSLGAAKYLLLAHSDGSHRDAGYESAGHEYEVHQRNRQRNQCGNDACPENSPRAPHALSVVENIQHHDGGGGLGSVAPDCEFLSTAFHDSVVMRS